MQLNTDALDNADFSSGTEEPETTSGPTELEQQKVWQREILFWVYLGIIGLLYLAFFFLVIKCLCSRSFFASVAAYKHMGILILALLIVPSILLWAW